ncbi:cyclin-domain-containing protein [Mycena maculata]|uniref:Cyclin-domain-containing protein n=1 Tax=Mycena maculata TaxID=230809 RepID=A0AAD7NC70_9AGAR|nr:cyclin-domain-containing protein [Mycena maculata]
MLALHAAVDVPHRPTTAQQRPCRPPPRKSASSASSSSRPPVAPPTAHRLRPQPPPSPPRLNPQPPEQQPPPPPAPAPASPPAPPPPAPFDVHSYPSPDLLRLLASLLAQIAATNDKLDAATPDTPPSTTPTRTTLATVTASDAPIWRTLTTASRTAVSTPASVLTFHARNVPTISLEAYLLRILKYCPTTNEVFLSLLVYFDRMSKLSAEATGRTFVIDSYNIHRLVIAGVTVASKFFSDVFYTNSRYAKVGGLPQTELNQLELQFLLLNDFRLVIPRDEMQRYAEQLILFSNAPHTPSSAPPSSTFPPSASSSSAGHVPPVVAAPMQAMGAIDAYGGRVPDPSFSVPVTANGSLPPGPFLNGTASSSYASFTGFKTPRRPPVDDDTETETETETEGTETDGGWTTDDEPTIRPGSTRSHSGSDDSRSLSSADDTGDEEEGEGDEEREGDEMEDVIEGEEGDRTPERAIGAGWNNTGVGRNTTIRRDRTPERRGMGVGRRS